MNPYSYPAVEPYFNLRLKETTKSWLRYVVDFPIAKPTRYYKESNIARGELFRPREGHTGPLAILIHGWGDDSVIPCKLLAKALVKRGVASFILYLVFHSSRMPEAMRGKGLHLSPEEWFEGYQTSVIDIRQIVDWATSRGEINKEQIAVIGISLGGIIAAISMGVDKRISAGVFLVTGGNFENPAWLKEKRDSHKEAEYSETQERYAQYLAEVAEKGVENVTPPKKSYLTDPLTFASYLRKRPVMMINALWDESISRQATLDFWEACGKPAIRWFPATHTTIWLWYPFIRRKITNFLTSAFGIERRESI
jgi:predicted esterase